MLGRDHGARPIAVDRTALEDPIGLREGQPGVQSESLADVLVARQIILAAPSVEAKALRAPLIPAAQHDGAGVPKPDVAERLDEDLREGRKLAGAIRCAVVGSDERDLLASAAGVDRLRKGGDFVLGGLEIAEPQLRDRSGIRSKPPRGTPTREGAALPSFSYVAANSAARYRQAARPTQKWLVTAD